MNRGHRLLEVGGYHSVPDIKGKERKTNIRHRTSQQFTVSCRTVGNKANLLSHLPTMVDIIPCGSLW